MRRRGGVRGRRRGWGWSRRRGGCIRVRGRREGCIGREGRGKVDFERWGGVGVEFYWIELCTYGNCEELSDIQPSDNPTYLSTTGIITSLSIRRLYTYPQLDWPPLEVVLTHHCPDWERKQAANQIQRQCHSSERLCDPGHREPRLEQIFLQYRLQAPSLVLGTSSITSRARLVSPA